MNNIKAIVLDIDGTLYNSKKEITALTRQVLLNAQKKGIKVVLASGRPTTGMISIGEELSMEQYKGFYVSFNGSKVIDAHTLEELFDYPMDIQDVTAVLHHMKAFDRTRVMINHGEYMYVEDVYDSIITFQNAPFNVYRYEARGGNFKLCEVDDLEEFVDFPVNKILTTADPEYLKANFEAMAAPFMDKLSGMFTGPFYYEFTAKGVDKAKALDALFTALHIKKEEIISFGDGQNDTSIISYAGIGVAMGNAVEELKAIADEVTLSNDEDGIAISLLKHLPELIDDK